MIILDPPPLVLEQQKRILHHPGFPKRYFFRNVILGVLGYQYPHLASNAAVKDERLLISPLLPLLPLLLLHQGFWAPLFRFLGGNLKSRTKTFNKPFAGWSSTGGATWGRQQQRGGPAWQRRWQRWAAPSSTWSAGQKPRPPCRRSQCCYGETGAFHSHWTLRLKTIMSIKVNIVNRTETKTHPSQKQGEAREGWRASGARFFEYVFNKS